MRMIKRKEDEKLPFLPLSKILFIIFFIFLFYFLFYFNYFQIKRVVVIGSKSIQDSSIEAEVFSNLSNRRFFIFPGKNIFLIKKYALKRDLKKKFSRIRQLEISRIYPDVLKIKIFEFEPKMIWQSGDKNYFVDDEGRVYSEAESREAEKTGLPKIKDAGEKEVQIFENVLFLKHVNFIQTAISRLPKEGTEIAAVEMPAKLAQEIHFLTLEGWKIMFNVDKDADAQINNLVTVLQQEVKERRESLEYVDLRVENWVYYKMRTGPRAENIKPLRLK